MPRPLRPKIPGFFHVVARGVDRCDVFREPDDRVLFLRVLAVAARDATVIVRAFCLMTTHYHLVVEARKPTLSVALQRLNGRYAQLFNEHHGRSGHLFGGRFWADLIESDEQFEKVCAYVVENPVRAGLVAHWRAWPWSRYSSTGSCLRGPW